MRKFISTTRKQREQLAKIFSCTTRTVEYALSFDSQKGNTDRAKRIRMAAMKMGAQTHVVTTEMECWHDSDNVIRMLLPNGAMIELDKTDGQGRILLEGELVAEYEDVKVAGIGAIQQRAMAL